MPKKEKLAWALFDFGCGVTAFVALVAVSGSVPPWALCLLALLTGMFLSAGTVQFGWAGKAPYAVGRPVRAVFIHGVIWLAVVVTVIAVWPPPPSAHIHITKFDFSIPDAATGHAEVR